MDVRDLILTEGQLAGTEAVPAAPAGLSDLAVVWPEYDVVFRDGPDAVVCHRGDEGDELLVMLMSRGQFYIRGPEAGEARALDAEGLSAFLSGLGPEGIDAVPWCSRLTGDPRDARTFCELVSDRTFAQLARRSMVWAEYGSDPRAIGRSAVTRCLSGGQKAVVRAAWAAAVGDIGQESAAVTLGVSCGLRKPWTRDGEVAVTARIRGDTLSAYRDLFADVDKTAALRDALGLDTLRSYMCAWASLPARPAWSYEVAYLGDLLSLADEAGIDFKPKALLEYATGAARRALAAVSPAEARRWVADWHDVLLMELAADGEVADKYPRDLLTAREEMMVRINRAVTARAGDVGSGFAERADQLEPNEWVSGRYFIEVPLTVEDLLDEARQQHNCVGGYADAYASGGTDIYLMREVEDPDRSCVTVEVRNGSVRQAYGAYNADLTEEQAGWLSEWCRRCGFQMPERFYPQLVGDPARGDNLDHGILVGPDRAGRGGGRRT